MPEELNDPLLVTFVGGTMLLSLATGFYLLAPRKRTAADVRTAPAGALECVRCRARSGHGNDDTAYGCNHR